MDYEELCDVTGNSQRLLNQIYDSGSPIGQATNRKLMRDLRIYMAVGGMPQAVEAYEAGKNFSEIDMVKRQIITLSRVEKQEVNTRKVLEIEERQFYKAMTRKQGALKIVKNHLFFKNFNS